MDEDTLRGEASNYRIYEVIASGAFGSVYFGRNTATNVPVAVKRLHPHLKDQPGIVDRFNQEAATVRGLVHPNIVRMLDQGRDERGVPFLVMEWVEGLTVGGWLERRGQYPAGEAAEVAHDDDVFNCPACQRQIPVIAEVCPRCGARVRTGPAPREPVAR